MGLRIPRFHPLSDMPLFETQRTLRGHNFHPNASVLRTLAPHTPRPTSEEARCLVYHSPWGHLVVTEIDPENLNGYGWTCLSNNPHGAEWGDLGYMGEYERRRDKPWEFWERDLFSQDANAAAAVARILQRYAPPGRPDVQKEPDHEHAPQQPNRQHPQLPPLPLARRTGPEAR
ncbi:hypothetical protein [Streptomyces sp. NPDC057199]|uniref:hypothetical protein n=1 Tax=Streptomyces sp. NPDC057199 TaxID=3346047 RepID=UPI00362B134B